MRDKRGSPAEGVPFLGTKETPEALIYPMLYVNRFNNVFINAREAIATALAHGERSRDKRAPRRRGDRMK
jgi:hypothetical protein